MKAWWSELNQRQQRAVLALGVVLIVTAGYVGLWEPWVEAKHRHAEEVAYHQATLDWLGTLAPVLETLQDQQTLGQLSEGQSLLSLTDQTARAAGLAGALSRIEPITDGQVSVWLNGANFDEVMSWLSDLSIERGVQVDQLSVNRASDPALVDVRLTLATRA